MIVVFSLIIARLIIDPDLASRLATTQVGVRQSGRQPAWQTGKPAGKEGGIINSVLKIFNKYIIMRQQTFISVGSIGGLPPIPHFVPFYVPFSR